MTLPKDLFRGRRIGILGGSFNPAHEGHRHISLYALKMLRLDEVWWMVSPQNPLKSTRDMAPLHQRIQSALDASHHPRIRVTDIEQYLNTRYTSDTLKKLKTLYPDTDFVWLMGTDNLRQIHRWQEWQDIFKTVPVCVLDRPPRGNSIKSTPAALRFSAFQHPQEHAASIVTAKTPAWTLLHIPLNNLSATAIRQGLINAKH